MIKARKPKVLNWIYIYGTMELNGENKVKLVLQSYQLDKRLKIVPKSA